MFFYTDDEKVVLPITLGVIIAIAVCVYFLLRNKSDKIKNIPLALISITILVLEVIKQYLNIKSGSYSYWSLPLHFCSLFLVVFPLATLVPNEVVKKFGMSMSLVCCCWMTVLFYTNPSSIIGTSSSDILGSFYNFHTFIYHHLVILYLLMGILLNQFKIAKNFWAYVISGFVIYGSIAVPVAHKLDVNFCNILYSNIPFMETLRVNTNQVIYTAVMFLLGTLAGLFVCFVYRNIRKER